MITYYKDNKHNILAAGAQRYWHGTLEAYEANKDNIPNNTMICITNDNNGAMDIAPVGAIFAYYGEFAPQGYLLCDGNEFDVNKYPELFNLLGSNRTPDLRNKTIFGAGNKQLGDATDGALPNITYTLSGDWSRTDNINSAGRQNGAIKIDTWSAVNYNIGTGGYSIRNVLKETFDAARCSTVYKDGQTFVEPASLIVNFIIRATTSISISGESSATEYTTNETIIGEWLDGKSIYRKIYENKTTTFSVADLNIDKVISLKGMVENGAGAVHEIPYEDTTGGQYIKTIYYNKNDKNIYIHSTGDNIVNSIIIVEYTKV